MFELDNDYPIVSEMGHQNSFHDQNDGETGDSGDSGNYNWDMNKR